MDKKNAPKQKSASVKKLEVPSFNKSLTKKTSLGHSSYPFLLGLFGGLFTLFSSVWVLLIVIGDPNGYTNKDLIISIVQIVFSVGILAGTSMLKSEITFRKGSFILIISSILALLASAGVWVGPLVSLIGGFLTKSKKMITV